MAPQTKLPEPGVVESLRIAFDRWHVARRAEHWAPRVAALFAAAVAAAAGLSEGAVRAIITDVLPIALGITSIMAGFITTAQSLLLVLLDRPITRVLRASGHYEALVGYLWEVGRSMVWFIATAIAVLIGKACNVPIPACNRLLPGLLAGGFVWVCLNVLRMNRLMFKLLLNKEAEPPTGP